MMKLIQNCQLLILQKEVLKSIKKQWMKLIKTTYAVS